MSETRRAGFDALLMRRTIECAGGIEDVEKIDASTRGKVLEASIARFVTPMEAYTMVLSEAGMLPREMLS